MANKLTEEIGSALRTATITDHLFEAPTATPEKEANFSLIEIPVIKRGVELASQFSFVLEAA